MNNVLHAISRNAQRAIVLSCTLLVATQSWAARYALDDITANFRETVAINNTGKIIGISHDNRPAILEPNAGKRYGTSTPLYLQVADNTSGTPVVISYSEIHLTGISNSNPNNSQDIIEVITGWYVEGGLRHGIYWEYNGGAYTPYKVPDYALKIKQCPPKATGAFCFPASELDAIKATAQTKCLALYNAITTFDDNTEYPIECDQENIVHGINDLGMMVGESKTSDGQNRAVFWVKQETTAGKKSYRGYDLGFNRILKTLSENMATSNRSYGRGLLFGRSGTIIYGELNNPSTGVPEPVIWNNIGGGTYDYPVKLPLQSTLLWLAEDKSYLFRPTSQNSAEPIYFNNLPVSVTAIDSSTIYGYYQNETGQTIPITWSYNSGKTGVRVDAVSDTTLVGVFIDKDTDKLVNISWPKNSITSPTGTITAGSVYDTTFFKIDVSTTPTLATNKTGYLRGAKAGEIVGASLLNDSTVSHAFLYTGDNSCGLQDINELLAAPYNSGGQELTDVVAIAGGTRPNRILVQGITAANPGVVYQFVLSPVTIDVDVQISLSSDHNKMFVGQAHNYRMRVTNSSERFPTSAGNYATCIYVTLKDHVDLGTTSDPDWKPGGLTFSKATIFHDDQSPVDPNRETCKITYIDLTCRIAHLDPGQSVQIVVESVARPLMADRSIRTTAEVAPLEKDLDQTNNAQFHYMAVKRENCFIATAAYGSYLDPHVRTLRDFRDRFLLPNPIGRAFVNWYYDHSPKFANYISENANVKAWVRAILFPLVIIVKYPAAVTLLAIMSLLLARRSRFQRVANSH